MDTKENIGLRGSDLGHPSILDGNRIADDFFYQMRKQNPFDAPFYDLKELAYESDDGGLSESSRTKNKALIQKTHQEASKILNDFYSSGLPKNMALKDQIADPLCTLEILQMDLEAQSRNSAFSDHLMPFNQLESRPMDLALLGSGTSVQPFRSVEDHLGWLRKLSDFSQWCDQAIANMQVGLERKITLPRTCIEKTLDQIKGLILPNLEESVFFKPAKEKDPLLQGEYRRVMQSIVYPNLEKLLLFLNERYIPLARTTDGWLDLPEGPDWYQARMFQQLHVHRTAKDIFDLGKESILKIKEQIRSLGDSPSFHRLFQSEEDALEAYRRVHLEIDKLMGDFFETPVPLPLEIRPVEKYKAAFVPGAYYHIGTEDGATPGIFYLNTENLERNPPNRTNTLFLHEANPGHHYQLSLAKTMKTTASTYRKHFYANSFGEGWALYCEHLGHEMGLFNEPEQLYGHLKDQILRAVRLVVDTGLHAFGWTRQQAIAEMLAAGIPEIEATPEVERYMVLPAQALGYWVGFDHILNLRRVCEVKEGKNFSLKRFHSGILNRGCVPLGLLR